MRMTCELRWCLIFVFYSCLVSVLCESPGIGNREDGLNSAKKVRSLTHWNQSFESLYRPYLEFIDRVFENLQGVEKTVNISKQCRNQTNEVLELAGAADRAALNFFDATGKPPSGILRGGISLLGFYSQCLDAQIKNGSHAKGSYCLVKMKFRNESAIFPKASFDVFTLSQNKPVIGICVPSACSSQDVYSAVSDSSRVLSGEIDGLPECYVKASSSLDIASAVMIALFTTVAVIAIFATIYDGKNTAPLLKHENSELGRKLSSNGNFASQISITDSSIYDTSGSTIQLHNSKVNKAKGTALRPFILAFSFKRNATKIFSVENSTDSIGSLHGLRLFSMLLIIFGHTFSFATQDMFFRNTDTMSDAPKGVTAQIFSNGTLAVDTFYFISGLLIAFLTLKTLKHKEGKLPYLYFYLHRYIRITPLFLIVISFCATLLQYLGSGPNWNFSIMMYSPWCKKNWYLNALYVHNFFETENMCLSHSWYLATDMQFYIVTPLLIVPLYKSRLWGAVSIGAFLVATTVTTGVLTAIKNYPAIPYINNAESPEVMNEYYREVYIKPYCRMGPYLIGIIAGYIIWKHKSITIKKLYVGIGWILSTFIMLFVLFIMHGANEGNLPSVSVAAAYSALARTAWAMGLGWLTLMCHYGYGGLVNSILSFKYLMPLSRLTYSAYLIHPVVMAIYYGSVETTVDYSNLFMIYLFLGNFVITYAVSLLLSLLFESPIIGLEKAAFAKK